MQGKRSKNTEMKVKFVFIFLNPLPDLYLFASFPTPAEQLKYFSAVIQQSMEVDLGAIEVKVELCLRIKVLLEIKFYYFRQIELDL